MQDTQPAPPARPVLRQVIGQRAAVSVVFITSMFVTILDTTIVNVALASMTRSFDTSAAAMSSVSVAYLVALAVVIPASGWLGDRFGTKQTLLVALALFTLASVLCGLAQNLPELVAFRVLQGVGGGILTPIGMTMLFHVYPPKDRIRAARVLTVPTTLAPALGPVLGGLLVDGPGWRWVFFVNIPVGLFAIAFGLLFVARIEGPRSTGRLDLPGVLLSAGGFAGVMYAVSAGATQGWSSPSVVVAAVAGAVLVAGLVVWQLRCARPLLDLRLFGNRLFRTINIASLLYSVSFLGTLFVFPLMLQEAFGRSAVAAGLNTFPEAVGVMSGAWLVGRIYAAIGPRRLMASGMLGVAVTAGLLATVRADTAPWLVWLVMFVLGVAMAHLFVPAQTAAFATVAPGRTGSASALYNAQRQFGMALGVAVMGSVLAAVGTTRLTPDGPRADLTAYHIAFLVAAGIALAGAVAALLVPDKEAAVTMTRDTKAPARQKNEDRPDPLPDGSH
ncbi:MDR family MFS transporter [Streptomyces sp. NPDC101393]|uniref:MDR family MFS transporter n=1 Tax=Streptomyces sp. NPDC101393 TaxID=3366141 RepID=UPI0038183542